MIAWIKVGETPAWTDGEKWYCGSKGIGTILNSQASSEMVIIEGGGYIPDMAEAMADYAHKTLPHVTLVSIEETPDDVEILDSEGWEPVS